MVFGKVVWSLGLLASSVVLGWWLGQRRVLTDARANGLVRWVIKWPAPVVLCLSFWRMDLHVLQPWLLPIAGFLISAAALLPGLLYSRVEGLNSPQTGSFLTCAFFSNVGYIGAYTAFALFGETAYALCVLYMIFFTPTFYTLGFSLAKRYGKKPQGSTARDVLNDELRLYPFLGMLAGVGLSVLHIPRPHFFEYISHALINGDTVLELVALGSQVIWVSPKGWMRPCLAMCAIKFLYAPIIALGLVAAFHIQGLPRMVVLLEASTPVGVSPLLLPLLFGLDRRLSNALWAFTTLVSIPWLLMVIPLLQRL